MSDAQVEVEESGETPVDATELALRADREDLRFLGREFLTWLLFHVDDCDGIFEGFRIGFGEKVRLRSVAAEVDDVVLKGGAPGDSLDARFAVAGGFSVREAELVLDVGDQKYEFVLVSDSFDCKRVRLPALLSEKEGDDLDEVLEERSAFLDQLYECLRKAFKTFLEIRLGSDWPEVVSSIRTWLRSALGGEG